MDSICSAVPYSRLLCSMGVGCPRGGCNDPLNCSIVTRTIIVGYLLPINSKRKTKSLDILYHVKNSQKVHTFIMYFLTPKNP